MDFMLGQGAQVVIPLRDPATGAPLLTEAGLITTTLYGPLSTTAITGPTAGGVHLGQGNYRVSYTAAQVATPGTYTVLVTNANADLTNWALTFTVGVPVEDAWRMRDLLVSIIRGTGGLVRSSQLIATNTVTDNFWSYTIPISSTNSQFMGSELVVIDPPTGNTISDWPSALVVSLGSNGLFTLNRSTGIASDATGRQYAITRGNGVGFFFEQILEELRVAYDELGPTFVGSDSVTLVVGQQQSEYVLPAKFQSVISVGVNSIDGDYTDVWDDLEGGWEVLPDRRLLRLDGNLGIGVNRALRVTGAVKANMPLQGGSWTDLSGPYLRERVRFGLYNQSGNQALQRAAQAIYANMLRMGDPVRPPVAGEVSLGG